MSYGATAKGTHRCAHCGAPAGRVLFPDKEPEYPVVCGRAACLAARVRDLGIAGGDERAVHRAPGSHQAMDGCHHVPSGR